MGKVNNEMVDRRIEEFMNSEEGEGLQGLTLRWNLSIVDIIAEHKAVNYEVPGCDLTEFYENCCPAN